MSRHTRGWGLLALLAVLAAFGWLWAQENNRDASPPTSVEAPTDPAGNEDEIEELLPPGERLSADNNLSWPVDI